MELDQYAAEEARVQGAFLQGVNSSLPPGEVAVAALQGAFPSAGFQVGDDGLLKRSGFDQRERTLLEDGLFSLNLQLASDAASSGLPLMQYRHAGADQGSDVKTIPRFLEVTLQLARLVLAEPLAPGEHMRRVFNYDAWARLLEAIMEVATIADCGALFGLVEARYMGVLTSSEFMRDAGSKLTLLRMSNMLFRRLSKAYDVQLCGRLLIFLSRCYDINDKSGLNLAGAVNSGLALPLDDVEPGSTDSLGEQVDKRLYAAFWGLQAIFQAPSQVLQPLVYQKVSNDMAAVLDEFAAIRQPVQAVAPYGAAAATRAGAGCGGDDMQVEEERPQGDGGAAAGAPNGSGGGAGCRYLTSSKLFGLQLRDCTFRRHFLVQCLALLQQLDCPSKSDKLPPSGAKPEGLDALRTKLYGALAETRDAGPEFAEAVRHMLQQEAFWVAWKHGAGPPGAAAGAGAAGAGATGAAGASAGGAPAELCRDFTRPPAPPTKELLAAATPAQQEGGKRKRGASARAGGAGGAPGRLGALIARSVASLPDPLAGLKVGERKARMRDAVTGDEAVEPMLPTLEESLSPVVEELDPDNAIDKEYRRAREATFAWRRIRGVARHALEAYKKGDDLEECVMELRPDVKAKVAAAAAQRQKELAAAEAAAKAEAEAGRQEREEGRGKGKAKETEVDGKEKASAAGGCGGGGAVGAGAEAGDGEAGEAGDGDGEAAAGGGEVGAVPGMGDGMEEGEAAAEVRTGAIGAGKGAALATPEAGEAGGMNVDG